LKTVILRITKQLSSVTPIVDFLRPASCRREAR
jgi:hypothetical protein